MVLHTHIATCATVQWFCILKSRNVRQYNGFASSKAKMCNGTMVLHPQRPKCATVQWCCILTGKNVRQYNGFASSKAKMCRSTMVLHAHRPKCAREHITTLKHATRSHAPPPPSPRPPDYARGSLTMRGTMRKCMERSLRFQTRHTDC
jgi:hypothetical protein